MSKACVRRLFSQAQDKKPFSPPGRSSTVRLNVVRTRRLNWPVLSFFSAALKSLSHLPFGAFSHFSYQATNKTMTPSKYRMSPSNNSSVQRHFFEIHRSDLQNRFSVLYRSSEPFHQARKHVVQLLIVNRDATTTNCSSTRRIARTERNVLARRGTRSLDGPRSGLWGLCCCR